MKHQLRIQDYQVMVHLGCSAEERKYLQPINFIFEINYTGDLLGASSDKLEDASDYVEITNIIKYEAQKKQFQLVENLGFEVFKVLIEYLKNKNLKAQLIFSVKKINVPIENLKNGVIYSCFHEL